MSDKSNEQISNLMDGELEVNASKFLLKRMASDETLSKTWDSYHLVKSVLQKESTTEPLIDIAARVTQQLESEKKRLPQQTTEVTKPQINRWLKPIMGLGIAASVAFMSVTMLRNQQIDGGNTTVIENTMAQTESTSPILQTNINASFAGGDTALVPPPSLSRYPSLSSQQQGSFNQIPTYNSQAPYIIIINKSAAKNTKNPLSPIKNQEISD